MKKVTITLPDDIALKTRVMAAEADTSMSALLCGLITEKIQAQGTVRAAIKRYFLRAPQPLQSAPTPYPSRDSLHDREALR